MILTHDSEDFLGASKNISNADHNQGVGVAIWSGLGRFLAELFISSSYAVSVAGIHQPIPFPLGLRPPR